MLILKFARVISVLLLLALFIMAFVLPTYALPSIIDTDLQVEPVANGLFSPTGMAFLDHNNILVLEKDGMVRIVQCSTTYCTLKEQPILHLPVYTPEVRNTDDRERGLLGVAITNGSGYNAEQSKDVFLYYTERDPLRNRVYKYQWDGQSLVNPTLILDLPAEPGPQHNGGKIVIGPDGNLYAVVGDLNHDGQLQNYPQGLPPDDTSVILRVNPKDGSAAPENPFINSENEMLHKYYAYGIRNSFGIDFDPLTGILWDTENGYTSYDEINLVEPGFNSGWEMVMGPISLAGRDEDELFELPGSSYKDPLLSWKDVIAPTDIEFFSSSAFGRLYLNNVFVGDYGRGNLYFFELNDDRDEFDLSDDRSDSGLSDNIVDNESELNAIVFGSGFKGITDIETGPDGFLYVLSYDDGIIYRILPNA